MRPKVIYVWPKVIYVPGKVICVRQKVICLRRKVICAAPKVICAARKAICAGQVIYMRLSLYMCGIKNIIIICVKVFYICADNKSANGHP